MLQVSARLLKLLLVINGGVEAGFVLAHVVLMLEMQVLIAADDVLVNDVSSGSCSIGMQVILGCDFLPRVGDSSSHPNT